MKTKKKGGVVQFSPNLISIELVAKTIFNL